MNKGGQAIGVTKAAGIDSNSHLEWPLFANALAELQADPYDEDELGSTLP